MQNDTDVTSPCMQFIFGTREKLPVWSESVLPVTEREGKGEENKSIGHWTKYGHSRLISFCSYTNGMSSVFYLPLLFLCTCPLYKFVSTVCFTTPISKRLSVSLFLYNCGFLLLPPPLRLPPLKDWNKIKRLCLLKLMQYFKILFNTTNYRLGRCRRSNMLLLPFVYGQNKLRFACPYFIQVPMLLFPSPFPSLSVTGRALSDQTGNISLVPRNELHVSWRQVGVVLQGERY